MAEGVGFEPTDPYGSPVFKTGALNRSAIPPVKSSGQPTTHKPFEEYRHSATAKYVIERARVNGKRQRCLFATKKEAEQIRKNGSLPHETYPKGSWQPFDFS